MNKLLLSTLTIGILATSVYAGVKKVYVGMTTSEGKLYVIECTNGNSYNSIHLGSNGMWFSGAWQMGYRGLSINEVAEKKCN